MRESILPSSWTKAYILRRLFILHFYSWNSSNTFIAIILLVSHNHSRRQAGQGFHAFLERKTWYLARYHLNGVYALFSGIHISSTPLTLNWKSAGTVSPAVGRDGEMDFIHSWITKLLARLGAAACLRRPWCSGKATKSPFRPTLLSEAQIATLHCSESRHLISFDS